MWATARSYEQIVIMSIDSKTNEDKLKYFADQSSFYFISSENPSNSVALYSKISKYFETQGEMDQAIEFELKSFDMINEFEVSTKKSETINHLIQLLVECRKYQEAIDIYKKALETENNSMADSVNSFNNSSIYLQSSYSTLLWEKILVQRIG